MDRRGGAQMSVGLAGLGGQVHISDLNLTS